MDVRHLELLRELADRGSVTAVALATHRTPSAVSQQLRTAEREFGTTLVEPDGRGLRLTDAGRLLADASREVSTVLAQVQARFDEFRGEPTGTVTVAALASAATFLLPQVLAELEPTAIDLRCTDVDISEEEYAELVADFDIVIGHSLHRPRSVPGLRTAVLAREPLDIAMRTGHRLARRRQVTPQDLAREQWYGVPLGYPFDTVRLAVEAASGQELTVVQRLRDNRLIEALVRESDRVAVLPRFTTPTDAGLVLRPIGGLETGRHVIALLRPDRAERLAVRRTLEALRRAAGAAGKGPVVSRRPRSSASSTTLDASSGRRTSAGR